MQRRGALDEEISGTTSATAVSAAAPVPPPPCSGSVDTLLRTCPEYEMIRCSHLAQAECSLASWTLWDKDAMLTPGATYRILGSLQPTLHTPPSAHLSGAISLSLSISFSWLAGVPSLGFSLLWKGPILSLISNIIRYFRCRCNYVHSFRCIRPI